jgi:hypothetical protein
VIEPVDAGGGLFGNALDMRDTHGEVTRLGLDEGPEPLSLKPSPPSNNLKMTKTMMVAWTA